MDHDLPDTLDSRLEAVLRTVSPGETQGIAPVVSERETDHAWQQLASRLGTLPEHLDTVARTTNTVTSVVRGASPAMRGTRLFGTKGITRVWQHTSTSARRRWYVLATAFVGVIGLTLWQLGGVSAMLTDRHTLATSYATANGQHAVVTLLDGSTVILNPASRLDVPADYGRGARTVRLTGEGLFTVSHRDRAPFTVMTDNVTTRVLGTTFMVRHYPADTTTNVAVRDGRVAVDNTVNTIVVSASRMVFVDRLGTIRLQAVEPSHFLSAKGVLALDRMSVSDAIPELARWYDVEIRLSDPAVGRRWIKGRFPVESTSDLMETLEWVCNVRIVRDGRVLTLFPKTER